VEQIKKKTKNIYRGGTGQRRVACTVGTAVGGEAGVGRGSDWDANGGF
jgi:hypothetical protein